ncbi:MAG TPA: hypothetical protein VJV79_21000 [Polyangiaceae bacterium]|nr:hypothetical protein [Polyangiaceae bacterium]
MSLKARRRARILGAASIFGLLFLSLPRAARAQGAPDIGNPPYKYNYLFPIWGKKLAARGLTFPLPFGVGINYAYATQGVDISGVNIAVNDGDFVDLSKIVKFDHVTSTVKVINGRLDLWALPFLNVYGLATRVVDSDTDVLLAQPFPLRAGASQSGYGGGFGATAAFSLWGFFGVLDMNLAWTKVEKLDKPVRTFLLTPRVGKRFALGRTVWLSTWVGAMRQAIQADTQGAISLQDAVAAPEGSLESKVAQWYSRLPPAEQGPVSPLVGGLQEPRDTTIRYKLDKSLSDPWNLLIGAEIDLHKRVQMRMEYGFLGRTQLIMGISYRFSLIPDVD